MRIGVIAGLMISTLAIYGCGTPLMQAVKAGDVERVSSLAKQVDVNEQGWGAGDRYIGPASPLHEAAFFGHADIAQILLDHGANIEKIAEYGTPLHYAVLKNNPEVVRLLVEKGADTKKKGRVISGMSEETLTPLQLARKNGYSEIVMILSPSPVEKSAPVAQHPPATPVEKAIISDVQKNIPAGQKAGRYDIAVVIGNRSYTAGAPDVDFALRDAGTMRDYLVKTLGYDIQNIIYAENATGSRFNEIFGPEGDHRGQLFKWVKENESNVFIYYAGHGAPDPETTDAYFIPVDSNPQFLKSSGYRLQTFYNNLAKLPAKSITVILDACFSGNSNNGLLFKGVSSIAMRPKEVQAPRQAVVFASARDDQMSNWYPEKQHSLFTYYFLKGLQGEGDGNKDRRITVAEMEAYVNENVPYMARRLKGAEQQPSVAGKRDVVLAVLDR